MAAAAASAAAAAASLAATITAGTTAVNNINAAGTMGNNTPGTSSITAQLATQALHATNQRTLFFFALYETP